MTAYNVDECWMSIKSSQCRLVLKLYLNKKNKYKLVAIEEISIQNIWSRIVLHLSTCCSIVDFNAFCLVCCRLRNAPNDSWYKIVVQFCVIYIENPLIVKLIFLYEKRHNADSADYFRTSTYFCSYLYWLKTVDRKWCNGVFPWARQFYS